ncbi:glutamate N-acetyltransferase [Actinocorallia herbida]|uniref:Arginine biosynthesis bifunctional protein ArgJ n=1 Tax=Actinocorallia herbida TaxID=58109 RepID=A0A3N1CZH0_9ACTN|nr:bifunctional glutamate N-acetyltransferase/amino-acid acetyltransferase ArgJ [Actinocorallia herbida]ROO86667.1 glutamate N-acetyltransferase [Actinocorallia herbida]
MQRSNPLGFRTFVANLGIKDGTRDFSVVASEVPCAAAGVFTRSRFAGPSVLLSREHLGDGSVRAVVTVSKNANVATGERGREDAAEVVALAAELVGCAPEEIAIGSTGVIGRRYPMDVMRAGIGKVEPAPEPDFQAVAEAIMTTDTHPKLVRATIGGATLVGVAKGVGMIEPDMATLLTYYFTDARIPAPVLDAMFRRVMDRTFNCVSVDTDTSTSDSAVILANGLAGEVDLAEFEEALHTVALDLTKQVAKDGEGATKLIEVLVDRARDEAQARTVAKAIVNSPLVKTAVHGGDPNWGRVAMAVGKCKDETDIDPDRVEIRFGSLTVYPADAPDLDALTAVMSADEVLIHVSLNTGHAQARVWGCDLSDGYVRINADYTT